MDLKTLVFNEKERTIIAEFIFAYQGDTLIKSEGLDMIKVLKKYELINEIEYNRLESGTNNNDLGIGDMLYRTLIGRIDSYAIEAIMKEYFGTH